GAGVAGVLIVGHFTLLVLLGAAACALAVGIVVAIRGYHAWAHPTPEQFSKQHNVHFSEPALYSPEVRTSWAQPQAASAVHTLSDRDLWRETKRGGGNA